MTDERSRPRPDSPDTCGPSTRAIRAASRVRDVRQTPTSVPIYQTATFAAGAPELAAAGITGGRLRISVGLEDEADLVAEFGQALEAIRGA